MAEDEHSYRWYVEALERDLGLVAADPMYGKFWSDPSKLELIGQYYLAHPEYSRVGREMILEVLWDSLETRLEAGRLPSATCALVREATERAMSDPYDRESFRHIWQTESTPTDPNYVGDWVKREFPDWQPGRSVWET